MGYLVIVTPDKDITDTQLEQFEASVPEAKRCPTHLNEKGDIWVGGSYSLSGNRVRPYVERMIRWFGKTQNVRCSAHWRGF